MDGSRIVLNYDRCDWWRTHKDQLPQLSIVAKYMLGIPASAATSQRFFSSGGLVVSNLRCSLDEYKVEDLLKIRLNLITVEKQEKQAKDNSEKKTLATIEENEEEDDDYD